MKFLDQSKPVRYSDREESKLTPDQYERLIDYAACGPLKFRKSDQPLLDKGFIELWDDTPTLFDATETGCDEVNNKRYPSSFFLTPNNA